MMNLSERVGTNLVKVFFFLLIVITPSIFLYISTSSSKVNAGSIYCKYKDGCTGNKTGGTENVCDANGNCALQYTTYKACWPENINRQIAVPYCTSTGPPSNSCECTEGMYCGGCAAGTSESNPYNLEPVGLTLGDRCIYFNGACTSGNNKPKTCQRDFLPRGSCYPVIPEKFPDTVKAMVDNNVSEYGCTIPTSYIKDSSNDSSLVLKWDFDEGKSTTAINTASAVSCGGSKASCNGQKLNFKFGLPATSKVEFLPSTLFFSGTYGGAPAATETSYVYNADTRNVLDPQTGTIETWYNWITTGATGSGIIVAKGMDTSSIGKNRNPFNVSYMLDSGPGWVKFTKYNAYRADGAFEVDCAATAATVPNQWNHVVVTYNLQQIKIYVNGVLASNGVTLRGTPATSCVQAGHNYWFNSSGPFTVGRLTNDGSRFSNLIQQKGYFNGVIDKIALYNRELSAVEVKGNYKTLTGTDVNNTVHMESIIGAKYLNLAVPEGIQEMDYIGNWFGKSSSALPSITDVDISDFASISPYGAVNSFGFFVFRSVGRDLSDTSVTPTPFDSLGLIYRNPVNGELLIKDVGKISEITNLDILDSNNKKVAGISNVVITAPVHNKWVKLNYDIEFYNELSGVADYTTAQDGDYNVYTYSDHDPAWKASGRKLMLDLKKPTVENISVSNITPPTGGSTAEVNVNWSVSDSFTGLIKSAGDVDYATSGSGATANDLTSGVNAYQLGSGSFDASMFNGTHLWVTTAATRTDRVRLFNIEDSGVEFTVSAFDNACNNSYQQEVTPPLTEGDPWISTKGGLVYTRDASTFLTPQFADHEKFSADNYWNDPFSMYKDESDLTTEILSTGATAFQNLLYSVKLNLGRHLSYTDRHVDRAYIQYLEDLIVDRQEKDSENFTKIDFETGQTFATNLTDLGCVSNERCYVNVVGDLSVSSGFSCNSRAAVFADNITINADVTSPDRMNGCIFISRQGVTIEEGTYKSSGSSYPKYDILEGFVIAQDQLILSEVDASAEVKDGLKVNGSLLGIGLDEAKGFVLNRDLRLGDNPRYPVVAIHFDTKYLNIAADLFGADVSTFKKELGFKPL